MAPMMLTRRVLPFGLSLLTVIGLSACASHPVDLPKVLQVTDVIRAQQPYGQLDGPPIYAPDQRQMMNYIRLNPVTLKK
jgi:hypothetical protein